MKKTKSGKPYTVFSDNPKMDTSGMAGKPKPVEVYEYKMPSMSIEDMMEVHEMKTAKRPEMDD